MKPTNKQIEFAERIGIDIKNDSIYVARIRINEYIDREIWELTEARKLSNKQIELAARYGIDISNETYAVGNAIIDEIMEKLNNESILLQDLKCGDRVCFRDNRKMECVISSIKSGIVYFKGGNGSKAYARNIIRI